MSASSRRAWRGLGAATILVAAALLTAPWISATSWLFDGPDRRFRGLSRVASLGLSLLLAIEAGRLAIARLRGGRRADRAAGLVLAAGAAGLLAVHLRIHGEEFREASSWALAACAGFFGLLWAASILAPASRRPEG
ncbi:hypothetical protein [Paludisphaera soli]|uniref:hypothetical protein n=1 Tax=Paludisphaera soli TaxID=2712865 RepID=UPI0013EA5E44|nr:hypothetical protein [Paludisphaera soli]